MQENNYSFIVRIWFEDAGPTLGHHAWRGSIEQVGQSNRHYFQDLNTLCQFIQDEAGLAANPLLTGPTDVEFEEPSKTDHAS
ncbi:MAG: hypothetical protein H6631_00595 [Anaerolineaceae bacterium]|nr:hypothetical protein [Anaerolineaceae bacterium]MCB9100292.1 hypothetical protein [Anaerolineales bacterium]